MSCPLTNAIFGIVGVLVGGLIGHWLAGVRDSASRRREFLGFLKRWRAEIYLPKQSTIATLNINVHYSAYRAGLPDFNANVERVRDIFSDNREFDSLTSRLGSLKPEDWQNKQPCDVILEVIDELIRFAA
jgi:hypothetical protein